MRLLLAISLLSCSSLARAIEAIECEGRLLSLDYALIRSNPPYGPIYEESNLAPGSPLQTLAYLAFFNKVDPYIGREAALFFGHLRNETDFSAPMSWQASGLSFPSRAATAEELSRLPESCKTLAQRIYRVVKRTRQGDLIAYEFDENLLAKLEKSNLELSFFYMGVFFADFVSSSVGRSRLSALLHTVGSFHLSREVLRTEFFSQGFELPETESICSRSPLIRMALQRSLGLSCQEITKEDLASVVILKAEGDPERLIPLGQSDFTGLSGLKELTLSRMDTEVRNVSPAQLRDLGRLEKLTLRGHKIEETPKGLMEGPYKLKELDLSDNDIFEFKRNAFREVLTKSTDGPVKLNLSGNTRSLPRRRRVYVHPGAFNNCESLTHLDMSKMKLIKFKSEIFAPLSRLQSLDLSGNEIRRLEGHINAPSLAKLEFLDLSANSFRTLGRGEFQYLNSLKSLRLAGNSLQSFPDFLLELPSLQELVFCGEGFNEEDYQRIKDLARKRAPKLRLQICEPRPAS